MADLKFRTIYIHSKGLIGDPRVRALSHQGFFVFTALLGLAGRRGLIYADIPTLHAAVCTGRAGQEIDHNGLDALLDDIARRALISRPRPSIIRVLDMRGNKWWPPKEILKVINHPLANWEVH